MPLNSLASWLGFKIEAICLPHAWKVTGLTLILINCLQPIYLGYLRLTQEWIKNCLYMSPPFTIKIRWKINHPKSLASLILLILSKAVRQSDCLYGLPCLKLPLWTASMDCLTNGLPSVDCFANGLPLWTASLWVRLTITLHFKTFCKNN